MHEDSKLAFRPNVVNTKSAYKAWGIDIVEVEKGFKKLQKLKLVRGIPYEMVWRRRENR